MFYRKQLQFGESGCISAQIYIEAQTEVFIIVRSK